MKYHRGTLSPLSFSQSLISCHHTQRTHFVLAVKNNHISTITLHKKHIKIVFDSERYAVLMACNTAVGLHIQDLQRYVALETGLKAEVEQLSLKDTLTVILQQLLSQMLRRNAECYTVIQTNMTIFTVQHSYIVFLFSSRISKFVAFFGHPCWLVQLKRHLCHFIIIHKI